MLMVTVSSLLRWGYGVEDTQFDWETHCVSKLGDKVARQWDYHLPMPHTDHRVYSTYTKRIRDHAPADVKPTKLVLGLIEQLDKDEGW